jgi:hypothetical protein
MNTKTFLIAGLVGGITNWLLGWLFYGILPEDFFTQPKDSVKTMVSILAGCLTVGLFISYIFNRWAKISTAKTGAKAGFIIGVFMGLIANLFNMAFVKGLTYGMFAEDVAITIVMTIITGAVIGLLTGKLNRGSD